MSAAGSSSGGSWKKDDESNHSIEMLAVKAQLKTATIEIDSLQRRNQDLERLVREKEFLL